MSIRELTMAIISIARAMEVIFMVANPKSDSGLCKAAIAVAFNFVKIVNVTGPTLFIL